MERRYLAVRLVFTNNSPKAFQFLTKTIHVCVAAVAGVNVHAEKE